MLKSDLNLKEVKQLSKKSQMKIKAGVTLGYYFANCTFPEISSEQGNSGQYVCTFTWA